MGGVIPDRETADRWSRATRKVEGKSGTVVHTPVRRRHPARGGGGGGTPGGMAIVLEDMRGAVNSLAIQSGGSVVGELHLGGATGGNAVTEGVLAAPLIRKYTEEPSPTVEGWEFIYEASESTIELFTTVESATQKGKVVQYKVVDGRNIIDVEDCG